MNHIDTIKKLSKQDKIEIYNKLNCWDWDDRLGCKPDNWDDIPDFMLNDQYKLTTKYKIVSPIIKEIEEVVKEKEMLKYWNVDIRKAMTDFKFEVWWIKRKIRKMFGLGIYSKKTKSMIREILNDIAENNKNSWVKENYSNKK